MDQLPMWVGDVVPPPVVHGDKISRIWALLWHCYEKLPLEIPPVIFFQGSSFYTALSTSRKHGGEIRKSSRQMNAKLVLQHMASFSDPQAVLEPFLCAAQVHDNKVVFLTRQTLPNFLRNMQRSGPEFVHSLRAFQYPADHIRYITTYRSFEEDEQGKPVHSANTIARPFYEAYPQVCSHLFEDPKNLVSAGDLKASQQVTWQCNNAVIRVVDFVKRAHHVDVTRLECEFILHTRRLEPTKVEQTRLGWGISENAKLHSARKRDYSVPPDVVLHRILKVELAGEDCEAEAAPLQTTHNNFWGTSSSDQAPSQSCPTPRKFVPASSALPGPEALAPRPPSPPKSWVGQAQPKPQPPQQPSQRSRSRESPSLFAQPTVPTSSLGTRPSDYASTVPLSRQIHIPFNSPFHSGPVALRETNAPPPTSVHYTAHGQATSPSSGFSSGALPSYQPTYTSANITFTDHNGAISTPSQRNGSGSPSQFPPSFSNGNSYEESKSQGLPHGSHANSSTLHYQHAYPSGVHQTRTGGSGGGSGHLGSPSEDMRTYTLSDKGRYRVAGVEPKNIAMTREAASLHELAKDMNVQELVNELTEIGRRKVTWHGFSSKMPMPVNEPWMDSDTQEFRRDSFEELLNYWQNSCRYLIQQVTHMDGAYKEEIPKWIKREQELKMEVHALKAGQQHVKQVKHQLDAATTKHQEEATARWKEVLELREDKARLIRELKEAQSNIQKEKVVVREIEKERAVEDHSACEIEIDALSLKKRELQDRVNDLDKMVNSKFKKRAETMKQIKKLKLKKESDGVLIEVLCQQIDLLSQAYACRDMNVLRTLFATTHLHMKTSVTRDHQLVNNRGKLRKLVRDVCGNDARWLLTKTKILALWKESKRGGKVM